MEKLETDLSQRQDQELRDFKEKHSSADMIRLVEEKKSVEKLDMEKEEEQDDDQPTLANGIVYQELKASKTRRKRDKKSQKEKERKERIDEAESGGDVNRSRTIEADKFKALLKEKGLVIFEVPSDGDCMYKSIQHQLSLQGTEMPVDSLRAKTATFMRQHPHDFIPFLVSDKTGDMMSDQEFGQYCDSVEGTKAWGGQIELQALTQVLETPIEVVQVDSPSVLVAVEGAAVSAQRLVISYHRHAYHLGEHYNSLVAK